MAKNPGLTASPPVGAAATPPEIPPKISAQLPAGLERLIRGRPETAGGFVVEPLTPDGSDRLYYRVRPRSGGSFIAVDGRGTGIRSRFVSALGVSQNQTFFRVREYLEQLGFPVPRELGRENSGDFYLLEDLGDQTLCRLVSQSRPPEVAELYRRALALLARLQVSATAFDPAWAYAGGRYDGEVIRERELNYFFSALVRDWAGLEIAAADTARLEAEFATLTAAACRAPADFFLHRDFQSRNLMVREGELFLIDFQGARLGPVFYDAVSLIEDPYVELPRRLRAELVDFYYGELGRRLKACGLAVPDRAGFDRFYKLFILIRTMQALGAFGWLAGRGKSHFIPSIRPALGNLKNGLEALEPTFPLPELARLTDRLIDRLLTD